jgi:importin subunit alpha-1
MADREQKKFERNLGKASDLRDARVRNAVELRKSAQDERLKKGRAVTESSSPLAVVQPTANMGMADNSGLNVVAAAAPPRPQPSVSEIPSLFVNIQSHDPATVLEATRGFRRLLSLQKDPPITEVVETGVVPIFVSFLQHDRMPDLQFEAAWALTNVASGTSTHTRSVTDAGAIPVFVRLLQSINENVKEQAVWALGNIAGDSVSCRDAVLAANAMAPLLSVLETTGTNKQSLLRNATWTLSNFCRGKPAPDLDLIAPALPTMARLVLCQDSEVLSDVCWAMSYLSDGDERRIDALLRNVPIEYLVQLISSREEVVQTPALRTIGNIVTGNDDQTDRVIRAGALPLLRQMLFHHKKSLRKEACWSLSNVTAGTPLQVAAVIACDIIPPVLNLLLVCSSCIS